MPRLLLFGGSGQLGTAIRALAVASWELDAPGSDRINLTAAEDISRYIHASSPHVIVNAAAYTRVDDAETNRDEAFRINAEAPSAIAIAARVVGAHLVHVSTDYVFDGTGPHPYATTAPTNPLNVYGASKLAGEQAVATADPRAITVRTAWVHSGGGVNFVATAVRLFGAGKSMQVVDDQVGTPTRAANLACALLLLAEHPEVAGTLHFTDAGVASWYDVACCVLATMRDAGRVRDDVMVTPVDSSAFPRPARRPQVSILDTHASRRVIGWTPPHWREGVIASTRELLDA